MNAATGIISYRRHGQIKTWRVGCLASETEDDLRRHLEKHVPGAEFLSGRVVPDRPVDDGGVLPRA